MHFFWQLPIVCVNIFSAYPYIITTTVVYGFYIFCDSYTQLFYSFFIVTTSNQINCIFTHKFTKPDTEFWIHTLTAGCKCAVNIKQICCRHYSTSTTLSHLKLRQPWAFTSQTLHTSGFIARIFFCVKGSVLSGLGNTDSLSVQVITRLSPFTLVKVTTTSPVFKFSSICVFSSSVICPPYLGSGFSFKSFYKFTMHRRNTVFVPTVITWFAIITDINTTSRIICCDFIVFPNIARTKSFRIT